MSTPPPPPLPAMTTEAFLNVGRIPDFVRDVKPFNGNPTELVDWLADVDSIFRTYREKNASADQLNVIARVIRRKISGEAADILNANNITSDWELIKNTLVLYYRDKRDVKTLDFELTSIKKSANENISTYYSRVNAILSHIIAQIHTDDKLKINAAVHISYFRDKALDAFIRGLEKPLNILLKSTNPKSLGQAYQFCMEYYNMDLRSAPYRNEFGNQPTPKPKEPPRMPPRVHIPPTRPVLPPPLPPRFHNSFQFRSHPPQPNSFNPNVPRPNFFRPIHPPQRPFPPSDPMEVDASQRTRNLNYGNRPPINMKRPNPPSLQYPNAKRQAHPLENTHQIPEANYEYYSHYDYDPHFHYDTYYDPYYNYDTQQEVEHHDRLDTNDELNDGNSAAQNNEDTASTNFLELTPEW